MSPSNADRSKPGGVVGPAPDLPAALVEATRGWVLLLDGEFRIIKASGAFRRSFATDAAAVDGQKLFSLAAGVWDIPALRNLLEAARRAGAAADSVAFDLRRPGAAARRLTAQAERLPLGDQAATWLLVTLDEVAEPQDSKTTRFAAAESLLLLEARHRISNGLQIVAAVLMQSARMTSVAESRGHLQAAYGRVMAVAGPERQLASASGERVALQVYLAELCQHMSAAAVGDPSRVSLQSLVAPVEVSARMAASLGMIVAELVVNAIKHAFPDGRPGIVTIAFKRQGAGWVLSVSDDGIGTPKSGVEGGLGTEIVRALAGQLKAVVEVTDARPGKITSIRCAHSADERITAIG